MRLGLFTKIFAALAIVTVLLGALATILGVRSIDQAVRHEAQLRVTYDLHVARLILQNELLKVERSIVSLPEKTRFLDPEKAETLLDDLEQARSQAGLDYLVAVGRDGKVLGRSNQSTVRGEDLEVDPVVRATLAKGRSTTAIQVLAEARLRAEGGDLVRRAHMVLEPTPRARPMLDNEQTSGLVLEACVPVLLAGGQMRGVLVGGVLLNRNYAVVDRVKDLVFGGEKHGGKDVGTVTIFQWDVRISTNVLKNNGQRAIQTRVSREVYDQVLEAERPWYGSAFVVNDVYLSSYEPVRDQEGKVVGMLYVGVLEAKYDQMRATLLTNFLMATGIVVFLVVVVSAVLARTLTGPLRKLVEGSEMLADGKLEWRVPEPRYRDEIHDLTRAFNRMGRALQDQHNAIEHANDRLNDQNKELERVNRNYMEMLGFVSHELKSPLSSSVMSAQSLKDGLVGSLNEKQKQLVDLVCRNLEYATTMIRNYLDLSRIEKGEVHLDRRAVAVGERVIAPAVRDLEPAASRKRMSVEISVPVEVVLDGDPDLLRIVFQNLIGNAIKYGRESGRIRVWSLPADGSWEIHVWNEGIGVPIAKRHVLFEKFGRVLDPRLAAEKGTGLGLFITRDIVRRHGGEIRVECEEGSWIDFISTIPKG